MTYKTKHFPSFMHKNIRNRLLSDSQQTAGVRRVCYITSLLWAISSLRGSNKSWTLGCSSIYHNTENQQKIHLICWQIQNRKKKKKDQRLKHTKHTQQFCPALELWQHSTSCFQDHEIFQLPLALVPRPLAVRKGLQAQPHPSQAAGCRGHDSQWCKTEERKLMVSKRVVFSLKKFKQIHVLPANLYSSAAALAETGFSLSAPLFGNEINSLLKSILLCLLKIHYFLQFIRKSVSV